MVDYSKSDDATESDVLPAGTTLLRGQYRIERFMVRGGFGITYLAHDSLNRCYVIKECFPDTLCGRKNGVLQPLCAEWADKFTAIRRHFLSEASRVAKLDHANIVRVHQIFEENQTAYMAMEVVEGEDLLTIVEDFPERLTPEVLGNALRDALTAITYIHDLGILHRDISPDNFLLGPDNHLTLIDFGAAREYAGRDNRAMSALLSVKDGYSPHEFYLTDVPQTAASDLYSLGATFYHLITGEAPPNSQERVAALAAHQPDPYVPLATADLHYDRNFLVSIDRALAVLPKDRIGSAAEWVALLDTPASRDEPVADEPTLEGELTRVISRLVEDTNRQVSQGMPGDAAALADKNKRRRNARILYETPDEGPKELVDIFGNPVKNVEAWMREQSAASKANPKMVNAALKVGARQKEPPLKTTDRKTEKTSARSTLGRLLSACLPTRRVPTSSALSN